MSKSTSRKAKKMSTLHVKRKKDEIFGKKAHILSASQLVWDIFIEPKEFWMEINNVCSSWNSLNPKDKKIKREKKKGKAFDVREKRSD